MVTGPSPTASLSNAPQNTTHRPGVKARPQMAAASPHNLLPIQTHTTAILSRPATPDIANTATSSPTGIIGPKAVSAGNPARTLRLNGYGKQGAAIDKPLPKLHLLCSTSLPAASPHGVLPATVLYGG